MKFQIKNIFLASTLMVFSVTGCTTPSTTKQSLIPPQTLPQSKAAENQIQAKTVRTESNSHKVHTYGGIQIN